MINNPMSRLSFLLFITAMTYLGVISDYINGKINFVLVIGAVIATIISAYYLLSLKFDGLIAFIEDETTDERIREIWNKARSNGFYVLVFCTWFLALYINNNKFSFILPNISLFLGLISLISWMVVIVSVLWSKYKI